MGTWIDFKKLRESLNFARVLEYYKVEYKQRGSQGQAFCPMPNHKGDRKSPSFSVSFQKNIFQCFGCGATGNVLEFIALMEKLDPQNPAEFRKAAVMAQERFGAPAPPPKPAMPGRRIPSPAPAPSNVPSQKLPVVINAPLDFELKNLDLKPQYLVNRGFTDRTMTHFGLGYCSKGLFAGRVVIPLHNQSAQLVGYAGRIIFDEAIDEENPKYLFPGPRERNGKRYEFAKSLFLYNGHCIQAPVHDLIVVEGFPSVWWLWQCGFTDVVALMGSSCGIDQSKAIVDLANRHGRIWILTDGDEAGIRCAHSIFEGVGVKRFCTWLRLSEGQPTDCSSKELQTMLEWNVKV